LRRRRKTQGKRESFVGKGLVLWRIEIFFPVILARQVFG